MLRNYLKTAWRNLSRHKLFTGLNIFGLATGMACSILIFLWVNDESSFDKFNADADHMFRIVCKVSDINAAVVPAPFAAAIRSEMPSVKITTRIIQLQRMVTVGAKKFDEKRMFYADRNFLQMFNYPLLKGNSATILSSPNSIAITEATAKKYFGSIEAAMGKTIYVDNDIKGALLSVNGILKDIPANSHLKFDMLLPIALYDKQMDSASAWVNFDSYVYFQLKDNVLVSSSVINAVEKKINDVRKRAIADKGVAATFFVQPLNDIHLHSHYLGDVEGQGSAQYVKIFLLVAIFIIIIACINFVNLATAISGQRAKEVGLRKTVGALRAQLIMQFISESLLLSFISLILALALVFLMLPAFNSLASKSISFDFLTIKVILSLLGIILAVGLLSGSYPAFILSSFNPVSALKGAKTISGKKSFLRSGLVVLQFSISIILMVSTIVVYNQLHYIQNQDIGFNKENLLYMQMPKIGDLKNNNDALIAALNRDPKIKNYSIVSDLPTNLTSESTLEWKEKDPKTQVLASRLQTDENFVKTFQMKMVAGRFFSRDFGSNDSSFVVNETALKTMNMNIDNAVGKQIKLGRRTGEIIGVVKDFNFKSVHELIEPMVMQTDFSGGYVVMRTTPANIRSIIEEIKKNFQNVYGDFPFSYGFVNEDLSKLYVTEQRMSKLFNIFSVLSIIISCLGLFGLATFATQKRRKEIGVRKVLGAGEAGIVAMLVKDFIKLVAVSLIVAFPVAWWLMHQWLQGFAYRSAISWWIFVISGMIALLIAFATVSFQTIKAALANPVKSLRTE
jgi:ABC-type antimicrobial peptide transport system permease subunit